MAGKTSKKKKNRSVKLAIKYEDEKTITIPVLTLCVGQMKNCN